MDTVKTGFITGGERNSMRLIDKAAEGEGDLKAGVGGGFGFGKLALHLAIDEGGFDHAESLHAPTGCDHLGDQVLFYWGAGPISVGIIAEHFLELFRIFTCEDDGLFGSESMIKRITG